MISTRKIKCFSFCMCCPQISVEAPWLSNIQGRCTVIGKGMLTCVDAPTVSLYMLDLHADTQMSQIHLQVTKVNSNLFILQNCTVYPVLWSGHVPVYLVLLLFSHPNTGTVFLCEYFISFLHRVFPFFLFQSLGLEVAPGFHPVLVSTQPNPARQPLSEFFLQIGPENFVLLQLNAAGQIVTLRDFKPVRDHSSIYTFL